MLILVTGSRDYTDADAIFRAILSYYPAYDGQPFTVMHGGARGADTFAQAAADRLQVRSRVFTADWQAHGRAAGPIRNRAMLDESPDMVLAFGDGRGTRDTIAEAERRGIPVRRYA